DIWYTDLSGNGIAGTAVSDLARNGAFPGAPSGGASLATLAGVTNTGKSNYGTRIRGFFLPPSSGNYTFAICTDDNGKFFLSTDDDPSNLMAVSACTPWLGAGQFAPTNAQVVASSPIALIGGNKYYFEAYMKQGGGGDDIGVAATTAPPLTNTSPTIPGAQLAPWVDPILILTQPTSKVVGLGSSFTLGVTVQGTFSGPTRYQWQNNGVNVASGGNGPTYTVAAAAATDAGSYTVIVSNAVNSVISQPAQVIVDNTSATPTLAAVNPVVPNVGPSTGAQ